MQVSQWLKQLVVTPDEPFGPPASRADVLNKRWQFLKNRRDWRLRTRRLCVVGALILFVAFFVALRITWVMGDDKQTRYSLGTVLLCGGVLCLAIAYAIPVWDSDAEIRQTEDELDLLQDVSPEQKAQKLFKIHQYQLNKYYDQTLKQSKWIFFVGVTCLAMGFAVVGASLYLVRIATAQQHYVIAALGAVGGLLSNFIGVIYLKMHAETVKSLTEFHNRLVLTHYLHFGNFLLAKIENQELREKSLAQVALNLSTDQTHNRPAAAKSPARKEAPKSAPKNGEKARAAQAV